jgi:hypothetical protein
MMRQHRFVTSPFLANQSLIADADVEQYFPNSLKRPTQQMEAQF